MIMKKLTYSLAVLLSAASLNSYADIPVCVPNYGGGFIVGLTGLYWRSSTTDFDNVFLFPGTSTSFFSSPVARFDRDRDYDWGYQINLGYVFPCSGTDVMLTYTQFDQDDHEHERDLGGLAVALPGPAVTTGPVTLTAILSTAVIDAVIPALPEEIFPAGTVLTPILTSATLTSAKLDRDYFAIDLDLGQHITVCNNFHARWFGGVRYANFERTFEETLTGSGTSVSDPVATDFDVIIGEALAGTLTTTVTATATTTFTEAVREKSEFDGIGPRLGFEGDVNFGGGFGIIGGISTALLVGETDHSINDRVDLATTSAFDIDTATTGGLTAVFTGITVTGAETATTAAALVAHTEDPNHTRIVPNIDAKLGLDFTYQMCNPSKTNLVFEVGYMVSYYWNTGDFRSRTENVAPFGIRGVSDTSFDGAYFSIKVKV